MIITIDKPARCEHHAGESRYRAERSRRSPNNLINHNPAFVGRVRELTELRDALNENR